MTSVWVEGVVVGHLFTFLPTTRASQLWPIATNPNPWHHPLITQLSMNPRYGTTDHWIYKTDIQFWALLGSWGGRAGKLIYKLPSVCCFYGQVFFYVYLAKKTFYN